MAEITTARVLGLRECDCDERWLGDRIYDDPSVLGLRRLNPVMREKTQSHGGRLDLLLQGPGDSMYEVEIQLGATDESHIVRTIEYWDSERRRWPHRSHTAVLVAEQITSRFFNVVHLLSRAVPIIGIQASIVESAGVRALHFAKILDTYEEPEIEDRPRYDENFWRESWPGTFDCVQYYRDLITKHYRDIRTKFFEGYVAVTVAGRDRVWIQSRKNGRAFVQLSVPDSSWDDVATFLTSQGFKTWADEEKGLRFNVNLAELDERRDIHLWLVQHLAPDQCSNGDITTH